MKKKILALLLFAASALAFAVLAPSPNAAGAGGSCSPADCGCDVDLASCQEACQTDPFPFACNRQCVHEYKACGLACCAL